MLWTNFETFHSSCLMTFFVENRHTICGDQLLVNCFDITNIYINIFDNDVTYRSAHVMKLYIKNLYKQDEVSVTRLQCICGIGFEFALKLQKSMLSMQYA